jgi:hypothetical protein
MKLYNCSSEKEVFLSKIELEYLVTDELFSLAKIIKKEWDNQELEDESIVIDSLIQIIKELERRY